MSTVLEPPTQERETLQRSTVGEQLQSATTAIRLHVRWPGVRKDRPSQQPEDTDSTGWTEAGFRPSNLDTSLPSDSRL